MKVTIDPVTRIEGHLRVDTEIKDNVVVNAKAHADMYRGIEKALKGYDYLTAIHITQRACGCCPYAHSEASALAIENALGIELSPQAKRLRNLVIAGYKIKDYLLHFYTLSALDFIDITAILKYNGNSFKMQELKSYVLKELRSNKIFPSPLFLTRYKANYIEAKELNFILINNYLESFDVMRNTTEMVRIFGNKTPHLTAIEPSGVTTKPTAEKIARYIELALNVKKFIFECYLPDVIEVAKYFKEYFNIGKGVDNFLCFNTVYNGNDYLFKQGFSKNFEYTNDVSPFKITEYQDYSYYKKDGGFKPLELEELEVLSLEEFERENKKYSWAKAPRYDGYVVEVGPAAVVINNYLAGNEKVKNIVDKINQEINITIKDYNSVLGRHLSRAILTTLLIEQVIEDAFNLKDGILGFDEIPKLPSNLKGVGVTEATRGALAHFIDIGEKGLIRNYEMIVPTTWNISPMDDKNRHGALESMLLNTTVKDPNNPIEIARIIRSIDPCLACSVH